MRGRKAVFIAIIGSAWILAGCGQGEQPPAEPAGKLYTVEQGRIDARTFDGYQTWRAAGCQRCHDDKPRAVSMGPSLTESLRKLSRSEFRTTVLKGRADKGMPAFADDPKVADNIDNLYAYLKGRADGAIPPGKLVVIGS